MIQPAKIHVVGLQRSGTNYVRWLLENNFHVQMLPNTSHHNWKHGYPKNHDIDPEATYFIVQKHPYYWVNSLMKHSMDFSWRWGLLDPPEGVETLDLTVYRILVYEDGTRKEDMQIVPVSARLVCDIYCNFYDLWNKLPNAHHVDYQEVLRNTEGHLNQWSVVLDQRSPYRTWQTRIEKMNDETITQWHAFDDARVKFYTHNELHMTKKNKRLINKYMDPAIWDIYGYEKEDV